MNDWKDGFAKVDGRRIHYLEAGEGAPLLLLHSGGSSAYEYAQVITPLAERNRVIAWDMAGHGDSAPLLQHHSVEDHRAVFAGLVEALGLDRVTVVGTSFGGYIGMDYGRQPDHRMERLVIVESALRSPEWYRQNWAMFETVCAFPEVPYEALKGRFRNLTPELHKRWNMDRLKAGSWTIVDLAWAAREFDAEAAYTAMRVPTTFIIGANGTTLNERDLLASLRPDARIEVMEGCGHIPAIDDPEGFIRTIMP